MTLNLLFVNKLFFPPDSIAEGRKYSKLRIKTRKAVSQVFSYLKYVFAVTIFAFSHDLF